MVIEKHLIGQKVIVPYVFAETYNGERLYLPTRFEPGITRNTEVIADRTI